MLKNMNRILILSIAVLLINPILAADKDVNSTIESVKIFRQGAQVLRTAKTSVPAGESVLKFSGISPDLDPQSIQLQANGNFTILSVSHQINYLREVEKSAAYQALIAERDILQNQLDREEITLQVLQEEEALILANKNVGGDQGMSVERLQAVAKYYRERLSAIKMEKLDINARIKNVQEELQKVNRQINDMSARSNRPTSEIMVKVLAQAATQGNFELGYLVRSAGWKPVYDLRVTDISSPVELAYKANVYQNSGEDWNKVQLSLSTGNPSRPNVKPEMGTWWLSFYEPVVYRKYQNQYNQALEKAQQGQLTPKQSQDMASQPYVVEEADLVGTEFIEGTTSFEFKIEVPYDIPSDGKQYTVNIDEYEVPAFYEYYAAPKLDPTAYLTAQMTDWEQYNLLNGEANLYFEGTYLGKSYLDVQSTTDTLTLSLGRDEGVVVNRKKDVQNSSDQFIGNKKTEVRGWNIELRNTKKQAINIVVEDQYPISTNEDIEVTLESARGAEVDKDTGKLKWTVTLKPGESETLNFRYAVKYPKKKRVILE